LITVHHLGVSQSERIVWLCEELEIPYRLELYERDPATRLAPAAYHALHPMGLAPVIEDDALLLAESGAIIEYIITKHGGGRLAVAPDEPNYAGYLFWFHFANGTLMPARMIDLIARHMAAARGDSAGPRTPNVRRERAFVLIEARLGETPYFAGETFTAADIIMVFPLTTMRVFAPLDLSPFPNIRAYLQRIGERPGYQRAMKAGDPGLPLMLS
jgi:glutathione S-transferase